ncbi:uncharacterized protein G2W53_033439 [Senna tora]|uniref:Uncharacterized protein n=1 Tax=Senna tora TaxID=362788 RepID=A0A834W8G0_9FABA|nr:uncharacterized protein G2W53_033439 [Senna tora]
MENMAEVKGKVRLSVLVWVWVDLGKKKSGRVEEAVARVAMEVWEKGSRRERKQMGEGEKNGGEGMVVAHGGAVAGLRLGRLEAWLEMWWGGYGVLPLATRDHQAQLHQAPRL